MTYLALGDSYTIGEMVEENSFPIQVKALLQQQNIAISANKIIAKTGWTTDELTLAIAQENITETYDWVSLLIGVNNQYRGRSIENYTIEFSALLHQAIGFANSIAQQVIVLSIPDWGLTPFNTEKDPKQMTAEIENYNLLNKSIALKNNCQYIDITKSTQLHATNPLYLAPDGLHYSQLEYEIWAKKVVEIMTKNS